MQTKTKDLSALKWRINCIWLTLGPEGPSEPGKPRPPGAPYRENQTNLYLDGYSHNKNLQKHHLTIKYSK